MGCCTGIMLSLSESGYSSEADSLIFPSRCGERGRLRHYGIFVWAFDNENDNVAEAGESYTRKMRQRAELCCNHRGPRALMRVSQDEASYFFVYLKMYCLVTGHTIPAKKISVVANELCILIFLIVAAARIIDAVASTSISA